LASSGFNKKKLLFQGILVWKDFNIEDESHLAQKPRILSANNVTVTDGILEIRFYWAGKGTTRIPVSGVYGPLISAFSIVSGESYNALTCVLAIGISTWANFWHIFECNL
jgi:hypothetical protein